MIFKNKVAGLKHSFLAVCLVLFCFSETITYGRTYYVTPNGSSSNSGDSFSNPMNFTNALNNVSAGDVIMLQSGTYAVAYSAGIKNTINFSKSGSSNSPITVMVANDGIAIFDFSFPEEQWVQNSYGFYITGSYWSFKGIHITRAGYQGAYVTGSNTTFENCAFYDNRNTGLEINKGGAYTTVINCDAYRNYDPKKNGSMADGFGPKQTQGPGNKFIGCRAWENSDDGYDAYDSPEVVTFENCWAFRNGVDVWNYGNFEGNANGFKVGGNSVAADNVITNCVAFGHPNKGFDQNNNTGSLTFYNCTAYDNGTNFGLGNPVNSGEQHTLINNVSFQGGNSISNASEQNNSWNLSVSVNSSDFNSLSTSLAKGARQSNGNLPDNMPFQLVASSDLIDKGTAVGLPYSGSAPDLGAFEYNAPTGNPEVNLTASAGESSVSLNWIISNVSVSSLEVYRDTDSNPSGRVRIASVSASTRDYIDTTVTNGTTYYYWIKVNGSINSNAASATLSGGTSENILVRARGVVGDEQINIIANGTVLETYILSTSYSDYMASGSGTVSVEFTNDSGNRDVQIDYSIIDNVTYQSEDQSTNTGVWQNGSCGGTNSEWLHCSGYITYGSTTPPASTTLIIQENEVGFCSVDGSIDSNNSGYTGSGFANTSNSNGQGVIWQINASVSGNTTIGFRYANGGSTTRTAAVLVDGNSVGTLTFPSTSSWTSWQTEAITISLSSGNHTIRLEASQNSGLSNIDYMEVTGQGISAVSCTASKIDARSKIADIAGFSLYPVPSSSSLTIDVLNLDHTSMVKVFDISGQQIRSLRVTDKLTTIDLSGLAKGVYFVQLKQNNHLTTKQFIKKH